MSDWTPKPGGFLEQNPHLVENYKLVCADFAMEVGELPEEIGILSREPPSQADIDYFRRLHGIEAA